VVQITEEIACAYLGSALICINVRCDVSPLSFL